MNAILRNSEYYKASQLYRYLLNLSYKITLKRSDKYVILSNRSIFCTGHTILFRVSVNKIENKITFKIKTLYYHVLMLMLLGSPKIKINRDEDGENLSHLEISEVALCYCNIANHNCQHDS